MSSTELAAAVAAVELAEAATSTDLHDVRLALGDLADLLGVLSSYSRRLSLAVEKMPDSPSGLRLDQVDGPAAPEFVCNHVANHLQAAAVGIDQARTAVNIARRLSEQLHPKGH